MDPTADAPAAEQNLPPHLISPPSPVSRDATPPPRQPSPAPSPPSQPSTPERPRKRLRPSSTPLPPPPRPVTLAPLAPLPPPVYPVTLAPPPPRPPQPPPSTTPAPASAPSNPPAAPTAPDIIVDLDRAIARNMRNRPLAGRLRRSYMTTADGPEAVEAATAAIFRTAAESTTLRRLLLTRRAHWSAAGDRPQMPTPIVVPIVRAVRRALDVAPNTCCICLETLPPANATTTTACGHTFCTVCFASGICAIVERNRFPVPCPQCSRALSGLSCLAVLHPALPAFTALETLIVTHEHHARIRYCANPRCATPFDWLDAPASCEGEEKHKLTCPLCKTATCGNCRTGWHEGKSCSGHRTESVSTDPLRHLATSRSWRDCPHCGHLIERLSGCDTVTCVCGSQFCYRCGSERGPAVCPCRHAHIRDLRVRRDLRHLRNRQANLRDLRRRRLGESSEPQESAEARPNVSLFVRSTPLAEPRAGVSGGLNINELLRNGVRLPPGMRERLSKRTCPYQQCDRTFLHRKALERHLLSGVEHPVWICCGRPFSTAEDWSVHRGALHN